MRVIAIELPPEDEVKDKDLVREFSRSRYVTAHNDQDETRDLYVVYICERIHRLRRDDFVFVGGPMQWACTEF